MKRVFRNVGIYRIHYNNVVILFIRINLMGDFNWYYGNIADHSTREDWLKLGYLGKKYLVLTMRYPPHSARNSVSEFFLHCDSAYPCVRESRFLKRILFLGGLTFRPCARRLGISTSWEMANVLRIGDELSCVVIGRVSTATHSTTFTPD